MSGESGVKSIRVEFILLCILMLLFVELLCCYIQWQCYNLRINIKALLRKNSINPVEISADNVDS
jgi:hypothetical protein